MFVNYIEKQLYKWKQINGSNCDKSIFEKEDLYLRNI